MRREVLKWKIEDVCNLIKLNPATLETLPDTKIKVNIEYQRGVIYSAEKQAAVIESILKDFAIPSIVLWENEDDKTYDVIDGKQRLTSIFMFLSGNLQINYIGNTMKYYSQISEADKKKVKEYELPIIVMHGNSAEDHFKHELFEILNITAESLNSWELLQGTFYGNFLNSFKEEIQNPLNVEIQNEFNFRDKAIPAKARYAGCYKLLKIYFGSDKAIREYVEAHRNESGQVFYNQNIKSILSECSKMPKLSNVEIYFNIIREIIADGKKYSAYLSNREQIISDLKEFYSQNEFLKIKGNDLVICIRNIFQLDCGTLKKDSKRIFTEQDKQDLYDIYVSKGKVENGGKIRCPRCAQLYDLKNLEVDHVIPWNLGGRTDLANAQFLCKHCNTSKSDN